MRIAICDDNPDDLQKIGTLLSQFDPSIAVSCFATAGELYANTLIHDYDAVFLDIEMESPNGYEIALRLARKDPHPIILFITNSAAYAVRGYGLALRYLLKPLTMDALREAMDALYQQLRRNRLTLVLDGSTHVLQLQEIIYAESRNHNLLLHTTGGMLVFRATMKQMMTHLPQQCFSLIHKSYAVNLLHVSTVTNQDVILTNGVRIPISRSKQREFLQSFHRFMGV